MACRGKEDRRAKRVDGINTSFGTCLKCESVSLKYGEWEHISKSPFYYYMGHDCESEREYEGFDNIEDHCKFLQSIRTRSAFEEGE